MGERRGAIHAIDPNWVWCVPILPLALTAAIYAGGFQTATFLFINTFTQYVPDTIWAWLTFLGNGWGIFAICFPLLLFAPRLLTAGIIAGVFSAITSVILKSIFDSPRPASILSEGSFYRIGEPLLLKAFPSGHTLTAFAIATALYFSCAKESRRPMLLVFFVATLVGLSRIGVGAHWLIDVLGGMACGLWCGMLGALLVQFIPKNQLTPTKIWPRIIALGGVFAMYSLLTQTMDLVLNLPLQYASAFLIAITLTLFTKNQFIKSE
jgi:membrane-associated phospholipid phosphatase